MAFGIIIKNVVIMGAIVGVAFLSQQPYFRAAGKDASTKAVEQGSPYWSKTDNWLKTNVWARVGGGAETAEAFILKEYTKQKNYFVQYVWDRLKNYSAGKFSDTFGTEVE